MRILVTGGVGYIGSHTSRILKDHGHKVLILDNLSRGNPEVAKKILKIPLVIGNIGDKTLLKELLSGKHKSLKGTDFENKPIQALIHFAALAYVGESVKEPLKYYQNNFNETIKLLDVICDEKFYRSCGFFSPIPIVFSSTCATYGVPIKLPIDEFHPQNPVNPYGRSKLFIEYALKDLSISSNLNSVILRYFNAAGASEDSLIGENHEPETHLIPLAIKAAILKKTDLKIFGNNYDTEDGTCIRDYIHVIDLAEAHLKCLDKIMSNRKNKKSDCLIYNLGNDLGISVKEILLSVEKVTGNKVPFKYASRREGDPPMLFASSKKIRNELCWNPKFSNIDKIIYHAYKWELKKINK